MTAPFPFIVAQGRSGTTLLRAFLDSHPDMAIPGESHFIVWMVRSDRYVDGGEFVVDRFLTDLVNHPRFRAWGLPEGEVRRSFLEAPPSNVADAIRRTFALYAQAQRKTRYGDKTPVHVLHIDLLSRVFPESRFIHMIRDGRDVALSYMDLDFGPDSVAGAALSWRRAVVKARRAGRRLGPERYREVRYEDLLEDPQAVVRSICGFVGLRFDERMLRYFERAGEIIKPSGSPHAHRNLSLPPTKGLRDWRRQMDRADVAIFEVLAGDLLTELGYARGVERPSLLEQMTARRMELGVQRARVAHWARKKIRRTPSGRNQRVERLARARS